MPPRVLELANPNDESFSLLAHDGKRRAICPLRAEDVDVVKLCKLLYCKRLRGSETHVPRIVDEYIEAASFRPDLLDCLIDRFLRLNIHLDGPKMDFLGERKLPYCFNLVCVFACRPPHPGIHRVTGPANLTRRQSSKAGGRTRNNDYIFGHDSYPIASS